MSCFRDYYIFPLEADHNGSYIWDVNMNMAAMYSWNHEYSDELKDKIVDVLNGNLKIEDCGWVADHNFEFDDNEGIVIAKDRSGNVFDDEFIVIRGWGRLTSPNCCGLEPERAAEIQNEFGKFITDRLNGDE